MIGIVGYGGYVPRLRLSRKAVVEANAWFAPQFAGKARGTRSMANWDEDSITMAVAAARDCLGADEDRSHVAAVLLASSTLPFAERQNAGIVREALTLGRNVEVMDITGSQRSALSALGEALLRAKADAGETLVLAADNRETRAASAAELDCGDGAAALLIGRDKVLAEYLGSATVSVDFVDHFRRAGEDIDYVWEERWIRDEGVGKLVPEAIAGALKDAGITAEQIDHFIFPTSLQKMDVQLAKKCGIREAAVVDGLLTQVGDTGVPHALLLLAGILEGAQAGQTILLAQFGSGAQAFVFRVTAAIRSFRPRTGVSGWLLRGVEETSYTKFLSFKEQLRLERGMRGEQDKKTALTTLYRHREAILGLVAGRCEKTGEVHFPPSRLSYTPGQPALDTQKPYKLAERRGEVLSWSAEYLSFSMAPPHYYGQIDFEGGGRILMEFTDIARGDVESGTKMEMVFRIKDVDEVRGFNRYFWKATPLRPQPAASDAKGSE
ncbi:MAG: OB-fold domain-containing protein [Rhodocyclaceae bacterium]|nr:OB-fold domain-containing protein [Rhodocyclaceae bacterium]